VTTTSLDGQRAWVFGGTSGIGLACAQALAEAGVQVVVAGRSRQRLQAALARLPPGVRGEGLDAGDGAALRAALARHGAIDHVVVSIGGASALGPYRQLDEEALRRTFENKFWQVQRATLAALPHMVTDSPSASVTWITGAAARAAMPGMSALAAGNGALHAMVGPLARELAPVRVNAVSPGFIDTPYWEQSMEPEARSMTYETMAKLVPVKRVGRPQDVAAAVMLCVSNSFMTGAVIDCDGGRRLV